MEAALKCAWQYFRELDPNSERVAFISREESYHGTTLGALAMSGHKARRNPFRGLLADNVHHVSAYNPYFHQHEGETEAQYTDKLLEELDDKLESLQGKVVAFIAEPVVGAVRHFRAWLPLF